MNMHCVLALLFGLVSLACNSGSDQTGEQVSRLPALALHGPSGEPEPRLIGDDLRAAVAADPGESITITLRAPHGGLRAGDRVLFDAIVITDEGGDAARAMLTSDSPGAAPIEVGPTWCTHSVPVAATLQEHVLTLTAGAATGGGPGASLLVANPRVARPGQRHDTIILLTSDTHRSDHVSIAAPDSPVSTPHLDALARQGVLFTDCFTSANVTNPSHIALMTGTHPRDTKITDNRTRLSAVASTLAEQFRAAGYQTFAAISAFHLHDDQSGLAQGFDRMDGPHATVRDGEVTLAVASDWLDEAEGAPVFLWVHLFDAHTPYAPPDEATARLLAGRPDPYRASASLGIDDAYVPEWLKEARFTDPEFIDLLYGGEVEYLDGALGPFLEHPRVGRAAIAFTSDHGEALGEQNSRWGHYGLQRATLSEPLILRGPGARAGRRVDGPVRQIDVGRTLLDMAGLNDAAFPGRDLRTYIDEAPLGDPRFALAASALSASIEHEGWVLELYLRKAENHLTGVRFSIGQCTLFDTGRDPRCEEDRIALDFQRGKRMREALITWLESAEVTGMNSINDTTSPEIEAKLAELGYSGGYESLVKWWAPEALDEDWATSPWNTAFQSGGDPSQLTEAIRTGSGGR